MQKTFEKKTFEKTILEKEKFQFQKQQSTVSLYQGVVYSFIFNYFIYSLIANAWRRPFLTKKFFWKESRI